MNLRKPALLGTAGTVAVAAVTSIIIGLSHGGSPAPTAIIDKHTDATQTASPAPTAMPTADPTPQATPTPSSTPVPTPTPTPGGVLGYVCSDGVTVKSPGSCPTLKPTPVPTPVPTPIPYHRSCTDTTQEFMHSGSNTGQTIQIPASTFDQCKTWQPVWTYQCDGPAHPVCPTLVLKDSQGNTVWAPASPWNGDPNGYPTPYAVVKGPVLPTGSYSATTSTDGCLYGGSNDCYQQIGASPAGS